MDNHEKDLQRQAYEELKQREHQMQVVLDAIQGGLKISRDDEMYSYLYVSDELCSLFGYTKDEFLEVTGGTAVGAVYPPDLPRVLQECVDAFKDGSVDYAIKYRVACKDKSLKWIIDSGRKVISEDGETIINSIYLDVTEMEEANLKIHEQKELLDSIYDSIMCGIIRYRVESDGLKYVTANHEAVRILGVGTPEKFAPMDIRSYCDKIDEQDRPAVYEQISRLKQHGDRYTGEYRIHRSKDEMVWVYSTTELIREGKDQLILQHILIDITDKKRLELALDQERKRFRIAIESAPTIIFEYDPATDIYTAFGTLEIGEHKHEMERSIPDFLGKVVSTLIKEPYLKKVRDLFGRTAVSSLEVQMVPYVGSTEYVWARITVTPVCNEQNDRVIVGKISNIQSEKEKEFALEEAKSRDVLTGLYTKEAGIRMVKKYMEQKSPDEVCGMMLLDMDNFQEINKAEGNVFADAILQEAARIILAETGEDDIQIRLGGDEFMLFIKNCDKARATVLGPRIAGLISNLFGSSEKNIKVSVSIGMCVTAVVDEYSALYRCAESTLKYVKNNGKGKAACYLDTSNELGTVLTQLYTEKHFINEIKRPTGQKEENLTSFALELLGKARNLDDAIFLLLARIGKTYGFDRVTVVEVDHDYLSYRYTYQWAREQQDLDMERRFYLNQDEIDAISSRYDEEGISQEYLTGEEKQGACLHAGIWSRGLYAGALSFEVWEPEYDWSIEQRRLLKEMVKIIFSFIMKARADAVSQAKTDFLSRMSHEIRTPMNAIGGMTAIAKAVLDDKEKAMDCLNKIESANEYLLTLINDILDMSRIESGKMELNFENTDLNRLIGELEDLMRTQAEQKQIDFTVNNEFSSDRHVLADGLRLNQVLVNIVGNALKFTKEEGRVSVRIRVLEESDQQVMLQFSVKDNGIGISREALGRIFNSFEQAGAMTASRYGGTGLGLSISQRLVQMMGGNLEVDSEPGKGSEFYFTLSMPYGSKIEREETHTQVPLEKEYDFTGRRILLAEDNELNMEIAVELLQMNGFQVVTAGDGREAVEQFEKNPPYYFDAVLMDIRMPVMDGLEATKVIRKLGKADSRSIPIVAMTANAFDEDTKKSMESGMNGHMSKPIVMSKLCELLAECFQRRRQVEKSAFKKREEN